jgi:RNA polymerase sigma-54 factor
MQGLSLQLRQRQKLAQQVQLSLKLLPLSAAQLHNHIRHQLRCNPALVWRGGSAGGGSGQGQSAFDVALATTASTASLSEHLLQQLYQQQVSDAITLLAEIIIDELNEDGYLRQSLAQLQRDYVAAMQPSLATQSNWNVALQLVQSFEPAGVAAVDLRDCLRLQLIQQPDSSTRQLALQLLAKDLQQLARPDFEALASRYHCRLAQAEAALQLIRSLEPKPGRPFASAAAAVQADAEIIARGDQLDVKLLQNISGELDYQTRSAATPAQRQAAKQLLQALQLREQNLYNIISATVHRQQAMLRQLDRTLMQPLSQAELAQHLRLHPSTISRAVRTRYLLWQGELLPLQSLFSHAVSQSAKQNSMQPAAAGEAIKATLQQLVKAEPEHKPLTDVQLQVQLATAGYHIARRTVAKYRQQLQIPTASQRGKALRY